MKTDILNLRQELDIIWDERARRVNWEHFRSAPRNVQVAKATKGRTVK